MTTRWGILGAGWIADRFASDLAFNADSSFHAIAARDRNRAQDFANKHRGELALDNYLKLIEHPDVDAIYIALPHNLHFEWAIKCIEVGKPVLVEKPFMLNARQADTVFNIADRKNVFVLEAFWSKFHPTITHAVQAINENVIGSVDQLNAAFCIKQDFDEQHRLFNPNLGGGALMDVGVYPLMLALWLFGKPATWNATVQKALTGVDEDNKVSAQWVDGKTATLQSAVCHDSTPSDVTASGTLGKLHIPSLWIEAQSYSVTLTDEEPKVIETPYKGNGLRFQALEVEKCLSENLLQSNRHSWQDSMDILTWTDSIRKSWRLSYPNE